MNDGPDSLLMNSSGNALLEFTRMPNPFHVGIVISYLDEDQKKIRSFWVNGWFGVSFPISIKVVTGRFSPYFLPYFRSAGPYVVSRDIAEELERLAIAVQNFLDESQKPYSFVPGVFDGWPLCRSGGHTSNNVIASLLHWSGVLSHLELEKKRFKPWFLAPGANPLDQRNIMPFEWFDHNGRN